MDGRLVLPPLGEVVTERVAELILEHWDKSNQRDADEHAIAGMFATSVSTLDRLIDARLQRVGYF